MSAIDLDGASLHLRYANRHGLVTGATGTGKTVTLQTLAESFSRAGVPVFAADIKGDLSGLSTASPVRFWDVFGKTGLPMRTTVHDLGPSLLSRMLGLNATQEGVLNIAFEVARKGLLPTLYGVKGPRDYLLDLHSLRAVMAECADQVEDLRQEYGNITNASVGAISRGLLNLEAQGGFHLFGEPSLDVRDLMEVRDGRGVVSLLDATDLMDRPVLYGTFMLWLLTAIYQHLPEAGDLDRPKLVFFFDEAHLLFEEAKRNRELLRTIERIVRLIRSKGVGVYFVSQSPGDVPDSVLAQLGNRVQHALRGYTPAERRKLQAAADAFRPNPAFKTAEVISDLNIGEALVSCLDQSGKPDIVQRCCIPFPEGHVGPVDIADAVLSEPLRDKYRRIEDREVAIKNIADREASAA